MKNNEIKFNDINMLYDYEFDFLLTFNVDV